MNAEPDQRDSKLRQGSPRILFLTGYFPPNAPMGAVRVGKLEQFWRRSGFDVRTIAAEVNVVPAGDPSRPASVTYLPFERPGAALTRVTARLRALFPAPGASSESRTASGSPSADPKGLTELYRQLIMRPDSFRAWINPAIDMALSWQREWKPNLIYSSGPPHSAHIAAAALRARLGAPWVAEQRDLWAGNPYEDRHPWLKASYDGLALKTLRQADGLVVVTAASQRAAERDFNAPVALSYNGFDPQDFAGLEDVAPLDPDRLTIVHAGVIYANRRDPTPLFRAIASLGERASEVRCLFFHDEEETVAKAAAAAGATDSVEIRKPMARAEILRLERQADILLECRWLDPAGDGVIPGKLFEYIGARRTILSLGSLTGETAEIIRRHGFGLALQRPRGNSRDALARA